jgi:phosphatidylglycerol:prolipoprotein diacylglycerol transferase
MHPVLFEVGPYPVLSYGVCLLLGFITLFAVALIPARRARRTLDEILPVAIGVGVGGVVGARLTHLLVEPQNTTKLLDFYTLLQPGTPGNIIGLMLGGYVGGLAMRLRFHLPSLGNYFAPALAAASVVWRIGCYLGGCCFGKETTLPWAIHLHGADRHPTMLYEGLFNLVMLWVLLRLRQRVQRENQLLHIYFASYAIFRFCLEYIRVYEPVAFGLTGAQILCVSILAWQIVRLWSLRRPLALNLA